MKKNVIVTVLMIVIFILGIAFGGVCMMLYNSNKGGSDTSQLSSNTSNNSGDVAAIDSNQANTVTNNSYAIYQENYNKMFDDSWSPQDTGVKSYNCVVYAYNQSGDSEQINDAYVDSRGDAYIDIPSTSALFNINGVNKYSSDMGSYKVGSNVADVAFTHYANGGNFYLTLLYQDGTVSVIPAGGLGEYINEINIINVSEAKNIVKIFSNLYFGNAVDINGNTISLNSYAYPDSTN